MKRLILFLLLLANCALGADQITLLITVTNHAVTGDEITINSATRIFTNSYSSGTIQTNSATGPAPTATNLAYALSLYPLTGNPWVYQTNTNVIRIVFPVGTSVSASESGSYATFSYVTQVVTKAWTIRVPMTIEAATNQTNFASMLIDAFAKATNRFQGAWEAMTNFPALAGPNIFTGTNRFRNGWWTNATLINLASASGTLGNLTNGVLTNTILQNPIMTNAVVYSSFRAPGSAALSEQIGSNAAATGVRSLAFGTDANALGGASIAIGWNALASETNTIAIGAATEVDSAGSIAIGKTASAMAIDSISLGYGAGVSSGETNSIAIGTGVATTETNQIMIGLSTHKLRIPGRIEPTGTITNAVHTGTNSIGVAGGPYGFLTIRRRNITSLANGNNAGIDPGGATYIKVSGPSAAFTICGFTNGTDGYWLIVENNSGYRMTIANDSGVEPAPANRIYTFTGSDIVFDGNSVVSMIYDSAVSRWICIGGNPGDTDNSYSELYTDANAGAQTLTSSGTYYKLTNFNTVGNENVLVGSASTNNITINGAGMYSVKFHISFSGTASKTFTTAIFTNDVECVNVKCERKLGTGGDIGSAGANGFINLPDAARIDVRCKADDNTVAITVKQCNLSVHKIE